jgi:hypothetical protein
MAFADGIGALTCKIDIFTSFTCRSSGFDKLLQSLVVDVRCGPLRHLVSGQAGQNVSKPHQPIVVEELEGVKDRNLRAYLRPNFILRCK